MATKDDQKDEELEGDELDAESEAEEDSASDDDASDEDEEADEDDSDESKSEDEPPKKPKAVVRDESDVHDGTPANLGATKYVHAAFFAFGMLAAYLSGKILGSIWNSLAEWPAAVRQVPQLLSYSEDERPTFTMAAGAVIGVVAVLQSYRKEHIRTWANDVALELSKCTWPDKDTVSNGTVVVCISTIVAAVYVALLDRFWGFVTQLVYGV